MLAMLTNIVGLTDATLCLSFFFLCPSQTFSNAFFVPIGRSLLFLLLTFLKIEITHTHLAAAKTYLQDYLIDFEKLVLQHVLRAQALWTLVSFYPTCASIC